MHLTPTEFDILALLAARPGVVFTRERLLAEVWGYRDGFGARTVDSHVQALRRKLGAETVRTVHGVGYAAGDHPEAPVARGPELERLACHHDLATVTIEDLVAYRRAERRLVARGSHFVPACPF